MKTTKDKLLEQLDSVIKHYEQVKTTITQTDENGQLQFPSLEAETISLLLTRTAGAIERVADSNSIYYRRLHMLLDDIGTKRGGYAIPEIVGIAKALRQDLDTDLLNPYSELIHAEVFTDFLEMADELLKHGYKDAAAVMVGSVLEEHIRNLCLKYNITLETTDADGRLKPKKATILNNELKEANIYGTVEHKDAIPMSV